MTDILVADDEPDIAESTQAVLEMDGRDVQSVTSADGILPALRRHRPKVLLQDVRMPGLDLDALLQAVRADPDLRRTRVVLFTADMQAASLRRRLAADDVVEKPFDPGHLVAKARQWMAMGPASPAAAQNA